MTFIMLNILLSNRVYQAVLENVRTSAEGLKHRYVRTSVCISYYNNYAILYLLDITVLVITSS